MCIFVRAQILSFYGFYFVILRFSNVFLGRSKVALLAICIQRPFNVSDFVGLFRLNKWQAFSCIYCSGNDHPVPALDMFLN